MSEANKAAEKIERERQIRTGGGSSVVTIPPVFFEFTEFGESDTVDLEADIGSDEIVLRRSDADDQSEK